MTPPAKPSKPRQRWRAGIVFFGTLIVLGILVLRDPQARQAWQVMGRLSGPLILYVEATYGLALGLSTLAWCRIMGTVSGLRQWRTHARIYNLTAFTRRLPGALWEVAGRMALYEELGVARSITVLATGIESVALVQAGLLVIAVLAASGISLTTGNAAFVIAGLALGAVFCHPRTIMALGRRFLPAEHLTLVRPAHLAGWISLYALAWCCGGLMVWLLAGVASALPLRILPTVIGIWALAGVGTSFLRFFPLGFGLQELALTTLLSPYVGTSAALLVALLMRGLLTINEITLAGVAWASGLRVRHPAESGPPP